ncbi:lipid A biosynthesis acyltransferase [Actimicrobium antarcticum]
MRLLLGLMWLLHWLPLPVLGRLGAAIGSLLFVTVRKRRRITLINLRLCLPELSEQERHRIARQHFQGYARAVLERSLLWWASEARLRRLIVVEPRVPLEQIQAGPTILLCPHFVCLDVAGVAVLLESSLCSIYTRQQNQVFDDALRRGRSRFRPIRLFSRGEGVKPILRAMREHLPFFMLPDMDFGARDAEFVPFFGTLAATLSAPARIAASTGAQVIPVVATFLPNYRGWKVTFYPAWENYPGDDMIAATRHMNAFIEERIREAPSEYFWTHKRFKTRPPGAPDVYAAGTVTHAVGND